IATAVDKPSKFSFLKSEADLEYIERRLKLDFINDASERGSFAKENVTGILENLKSIKAKHSFLRCQVSQITDAQKGSMELIRNRLDNCFLCVINFTAIPDIEHACSDSGEKKKFPLSLQQNLTQYKQPSARTDWCFEKTEQRHKKQKE
uniref:Ska2 N-terminal domain-containing protein n=1 Tax=Poecilia reticulata TaxID=8081 RepID=A0A3P9PS58_POERE